MTFVAKCPECGGVICKGKTEIMEGMIYCDHCKKGSYCSIGYLPDDPQNKVFAVDTYITVAKCIKVEAKDGKEAKRLVKDMLTSSALVLADGEDVRTLADMGFHFADELEMKVSGSADKNGDINYY